MKKIDTEKSTIFGVYADGDDNLKLGIRGYFSHYSNFETYTIGELDGFTYDEFMSIQEDQDGDYGNQWYDYFIPEDKVVFKEEEKEKKLRPYKSVSEFFEKEGLETYSKIRIRNKNNPYDSQTVHIVGFGQTKINDGYIEYLMMGCHEYTLESLFKCFEFQLAYTDEFKPFGVEVEE